MSWRCSLVVLACVGALVATLMRLETRLYEVLAAVAAASIDLASVAHELREMLRNLE